MNPQDLTKDVHQWAKYLHDNNLVSEHINEMAIKHGLIDERLKELCRSIAVTDDQKEWLQNESVLDEIIYILGWDYNYAKGL